MWMETRCGGSEVAAVENSTCTRALAWPLEPGPRVAEGTQPQALWGSESRHGPGTLCLGLILNRDSGQRWGGGFPAQRPVWLGRWEGAGSQAQRHIDTGLFP